MSRLLIAAPHKSSGKTTITLGLCAALTGRGLKVQAFKKGPDYIDPMWLGAATGHACYNLDFNTQSHGEIRRLYSEKSQGADLSIIEGNMGLFDSLDVQGEGSNAALAHLLATPVLLVMDVRGMTRTTVPLIMGLRQFDPELNIAGIILNKVAGPRHEARLREVIGHYLDIPVVGAVHRDPRMDLDERHLGLIPANESGEVETVLSRIAETIGEQVDLKGIKALASEAALLPSQGSPDHARRNPPALRIGIAKDAAFGFYYPDDLEALEQAGAELVPFSPIRDRRLPELHGLFIGGGFPETQMGALERNSEMRIAIRNAIEAGLPVYAECGGLMYLSRTIQWEGQTAKMVGIVPGDAVMHRTPVGRGYTRLVETADHPWPGPGFGKFKAHEFHYSGLENIAPGLTYAYEVGRGIGIDGRHDGFVYRNLLANYAHLRDVGVSRWAERFVRFVSERKKASEEQTAGNC